MQQTSKALEEPQNLSSGHPFPAGLYKASVLVQNNQKQRGGAATFPSLPC